MNSMVLLVLIGVVLCIFQVVFFLTCMRWLASGKRKRDKEFAILDSERAQIISMQHSLNNEVAEAKKLAGETLSKLKVIGADVHAEWEDVTKKINNVLIEVDKHSKVLLDENISILNMHNMAVEKNIQHAAQVNENLYQSAKKAQKLLRIFDQKLPTEEILKEIQTEKYSEAKQLLSDGIDASVVAKKLGISMNEVILLSSFL